MYSAILKQRTLFLIILQKIIAAVGKYLPSLPSGKTLLSHKTYPLFCVPASPSVTPNWQLEAHAPRLALSPTRSTPFPPQQMPPTLT